MKHAICALMVLQFANYASSQTYGQTSTSLPPGVTSEMIEQGKEVFFGNGLCVNCHGEHGEGLIGPNLTDSEWLQAKGSYLSILQVILTGVPLDQSTREVAMPPRGGTPLSDTEMHAVAAFVWSVSHPDASENLPTGVTPEMISEGERLFHGSAQCATCHGSDARGNIGPDLTDEDWLHAKGSYLDIVTQILNGVPVERASRGIPMPPKGGANISHDEVLAVAAYVWSISHLQQN